MSVEIQYNHMVLHKYSRYDYMNFLGFDLYVQITQTIFVIYTLSFENIQENQIVLQPHVFPHQFQ